MKESEIKYRYLFENSPDMIMLLNTRGKIIDFNSTMLNFYGYKREDFLNKSFNEFNTYPPETLTLLASIFKNLFKKGNIEPIELQFYNKEGNIIWVRLHANLVEIGNETIIQAIVQDITKIKKIEKKLKESEEKYRELTEQSLVGVAIIQDNVFKYLNQRYAEIGGYSVTEMMNWRPGEFINIVYSDDRERVMEQSIKKQRGDEDVITHYTFRALTSTSEIIWLELYSKTIMYEGRLAVHITLIDITERKQAEQNLEESELKYRSLVETSPNAILILDLNGNVVDCNKAAERNLSKDRSQIINKNVFNFFSTSKKELIPITKEFLEIIKDGSFKPLEIEDLDLNGEKKWYKLYYSLLNLKNKTFIIFEVIDITITKKLEEILKEENRKLKESEERYRVLFESSPVGIGISDFNGNVYNMNRKLENIIGFTVKELNDFKLNSIYVDQNERKKLLNILQKYRKVYDYQVKLKHKNGTIFLAQLNFDMIELNGKKLWLTSCEDITERKKAEDIINSLAKFPSENPNPVLRVNKEEVIYTNKAGQILFEIKEGDKTPKLLKDLVIKVIKANKTKTTEIELNNHIYSFGITPIAKENYVNIYGMNITEQKMAEREIQDRNKEILMLLDASRAVLQYSDFDKSQRMIFNCCNNLIGADAGFIEVLGQNKKEYQKIFINPGRLPCEVDPDLPMPIRGIRAEVIKSKKTIYHNDFSTSDWINFLPKGYIPINNVLITPLIINGEVKGLMGLTGRKGGFTNKEARIVTTFAELASISLFNSQTLEFLEKSEKKHKRLSNFLEQKVEERTIELKGSEEKIKNLINNISDVLLEAEPSGILTYISPQINNLIGYQSEVLIGLNFMDFVHLEDINLFKEMAAKALETKKAVSIECRLKHIKGYFVPVSARWSMVEINNEFKVFGLVSDNTERKKIDNMIKREIKQLKELDQIRNNLIRRISHELNTPLISILNGSQFLLDSYNDQMSNEAISIVRIIYQGGYRLKEMVNNLITAYELETDQIQLNIKQENLIPIVRECVEEIIFQADKRKIFINIELSNELNIDIDRRMIKKVILNLLSNAIKNTLSNGNIFIKSIEHHNFIEIIIRDTGVGLTKKEKLFIFKKFGKIERFGKGMDVDIEGPGLGLYISSEIVKLHKGEILVKSKGRNKGSTFTIRLYLN